MRRAIIKVDNEKAQNPGMVLRQFSKKVTGSGLLRVARSFRYHERNKSALANKNSALKRLERRGQIEKLLKLGKPLPQRGRRR